MFFMCLLGLNTFAETTIRLRGFVSASENGEYKEGDKKADEMTTTLSSSSIVIGWLGIGRSELDTKIIMDETTVELKSQWSEFTILFDLTEKTSFSIGTGKLDKGKGKTEYFNLEYNTEKVSGKTWFAVIGFDYKPLFVSNIKLFKNLEFMFGLRENLIEYKDFSTVNSSGNSTIKINSIQFLLGLGLVL